MKPNTGTKGARGRTPLINETATLTWLTRCVKVLGYLKLYPSITTKGIAEKLGISRSRASRVLKRMHEQGLIYLQYRDVFNQWAPTKKGVRLFIASSKTSTYARSSFNYHDLQVKYPLLKTPREFKDQLLNRGFEVAARRNWTGFQRQEAQGLVMFTPRTCLFMPSEIWGDTPEACAGELVKVAQALRIRLEEEFEGLRLGYPEGWEAGFKLTRQHMSLVGGPSDDIPEGYKNRGDDRFVVEASKTPEYETIHPTYAFSDMAHLTEYFRGIIKKNLRAEDIQAAQENARDARERESELRELVTELARETRDSAATMKALLDSLILLFKPEDQEKERAERDGSKEGFIYG